MGKMDTIRELVSRVIGTPHVDFASEYESHKNFEHLSSFNSLKRRLNVKLAGAFLLVPIIAVAGAEVYGDNSPSNLSNSGDQQSNQQLNESTTSTDTANADNGSSDTESTHTSLNSSTTTTGDGSVNTSVDVNGKPINVPNNGTTHQTIVTPSQTTTVDVSNNRSTSGQSGNSSYNHTNVHVHSTSNANIKQEENTSN
ncbi:MAG TPA: hypothetical protein VLF79_00115 [Candidatus Saccharimonadales bacterium]|nr:hypothetical protein [Candidatus Saccharimonadales bacterium]